MKKLLPLLVLVPFTIWSTLVGIEHGPLGFLTVAAREPWALQMLIDLGIAATIASLYVVRDAKKNGINPLPYVLVTVALGSIGLLAYFVRRNFASDVSGSPARTA